jgi:N-acetylmuramoyl-L-alanine amidase
VTSRGRLLLAALLAGLSVLLVACIPPAPADPPLPDPSPEPAAPATTTTTTTTTAVPATTTGYTILGRSELSAVQIVDHVCNVVAGGYRCKTPDQGGTWRATVSPLELAALFLQEGADEGVRGDVAFCQSILETGWFSFPGYSQPQDNNFAGIGAYPGSDRYMTQPTAQLGVRAQIQHLKNYADPSSRAANLAHPLVPRPRYDANAFDTFPYKGAAPRWIDLNGKWAVPGTTYGQTILRIYNDMRRRAGLEPVPTGDVAATANETRDLVDIEHLLDDVTMRY